MLSAGLLAGLQTGAASAGSTSSTTSASTTAPTQPVVTAVTAPAPPAVLPGTNRPVVRLGDMNTPEQFIVGQLYQLALQHEGYTIQISRNIGAPSVRTAGLKQGTLDIYPEYLGAWNSRVAHLHRRFHTLRASYGAGAAYARRHGFTLLDPTPFSDTSCVAVLAQYAAENHVYTLPQLAHGPPIIFGAPTEFQDIADGLPALERAYHLHPGYVQPIGVTVQYWWLNTGNVNAAYCTTTDPSLGGPRFVQLRDPKHVFGFGNIVPVTTPRVLRAEGPAFARTINRVDSLLTLQAIRGLNAEYEFGGHNATSIAYQFLEGNRVLPPSRYAPVPTTSSTTTTVSTATTRTASRP